MFVNEKYESLRDAKSIDPSHDTIDEIFIDIKRLMWKLHPELDPKYDIPLTDYYINHEGKYIAFNEFDLKVEKYFEFDYKTLNITHPNFWYIMHDEYSYMMDIFDN